MLITQSWCCQSYPPSNYFFKTVLFCETKAFCPRCGGFFGCLFSEASVFFKKFHKRCNWERSNKRNKKRNKSSESVKAQHNDNKEVKQKSWEIRMDDEWKKTISSAVVSGNGCRYFVSETRIKKSTTCKRQEKKKAAQKQSLGNQWKSEILVALTLRGVSGLALWGWSRLLTCSLPWPVPHCFFNP